MVLTLIAAIAVPLVVGTALLAADWLPKPLSYLTHWTLATVASVIALAGTVAALVTHASINEPWVPRLGIRLHFFLDGISGPLAVLAAAVTLLAVAVSSRQRPSGTPGAFFGCLLVVLAGSLLAFSVRNALGFFVAFEVVLIPMWLLIYRYGDRESRRPAAWAFVLYTVIGSMFMLAGILLLCVTTGTGDVGMWARGAVRALPMGIQLAAVGLLTVGLAVKVPLLGLHSWLPRAHTAAPTAGSMLLAAVLLKLGTYGFVRLVVLTAPDAWRRVAPVVAIVAVASIIVGGLVCLVERDLKRLVAWSSIAHMGFVMLALTSGTQLGLQAALYGNIAHGVISALLFAIVGALKTREGAIDLEQPRIGLRVSDARLGFWSVVGFAAALGLPGLAGFWGEALAIFATVSAPHRPLRLYQALALLAAIGAVLGAAYCLRVLRAVWAGEADAPAKNVELSLARAQHELENAAAHSESASAEAEESAQPDATSRWGRVRGIELAAIAVLGLAVIVLGVAPNLVMNFPTAVLSQTLGGAQ